MRIRFLPLTVALFCLPLFALAPAADARAGMGSSLGSRGSRTWSPPPRTSLAPSWTRPMDRSMTPRTPSYAAPSMSSPFSRPAFGGMARPSFGTRHPFLTGLAGGFLGAGLFGMLSGHGFFGGFTGGGGGGSFFGFILQVLIIGFIINLVLRLWRKPADNMGQNNGSDFAPMSNAGPFPSSQESTTSDIALTAEDYTAFQQLLSNVQAAWSAQDMASLQRMATPEMVSYFNNQLSELTSRGARNIVSDVRFLRGDLAEAWREGNLSYATVALQYSMIDVTTDSMGNVLDGSKTEPQTVTELWTFLRADGRGNWILSAIQQAG